MRYAINRNIVMIRFGPSVRSRRRLGNAAVNAMVEGLMVYGPHIVGLTLFAFLVCLLAAFAHFVLGVQAGVTAAVTVVSSAAGLIAYVRRQSAENKAKARE